MFIVETNDGARFESNPGVSILESATMSNIALPYSCKTGSCSTCKCQVLRGKTRALQPELGLTEKEKAEGWVLSCVRSAESDLTIDIDSLARELPPVKTFPCRISHIERLALDVVQVKLRLPPTADFNFIPGQYIDVIGPNSLQRSYSLANAVLDEFLELHIRAVEGGLMSDYWFNQAKINDLLRLKGPQGTFFLRDTTDVDLIFLATGTGIAPVKAILESLSHCADDLRPRSVTLLWGGRTPQDLYFDMDVIPFDYKYVPVLSRADNDWSGARGYVQQTLLAMQPNLSSAVVYACGSAEMIHGAKDLLTQNGLPTKSFYSDAFVCSSS